MTEPEVIVTEAEPKPVEPVDPEAQYADPDAGLHGNADY